MSKLTQLQGMLDSGLISQEAFDELKSVVVKSGGRQSNTPDKFDEQGNVIQRYCNLHQEYEDITAFNEKNTKKECLAGIFRWNAVNKQMKAVSEKNFDKNATKSLEDFQKNQDDFNDLKDARSPGGAAYNSKEDWKEYVETLKKAEKAKNA